MSATVGPRARDRRPVELSCSLCETPLLLSPRRVRRIRQLGEEPLCQFCQMLAQVLERKPPPDPTPLLVFWFETMPEPALEDLLVEIFGPRAASVEARRRRLELRDRVMPVAA